MLYKIFPILFIFLNINCALIAQHKEIIKNTTPARVTNPVAEYVANTVVFKIKEESREAFKQTKKGKFPFLESKSKKLINILSVEQIFPNFEPLKIKKNKFGEAYIDLSLLYVLKYEGNYSVKEVSSIIQKSGLVEYAEPQYIDKVLSIPNDPYTQPDTSQYTYFSRMKAYEAFSVEEGDTNVVIGIIDTGVKWDHEDLKGNIKYNYADPIDGIDNDLDGYTDNFRGWDMGNGDNNPYYAAGDQHGTIVAGCAGATTNNNVGIAGTGFKCKFLPIKASSDGSSSLSAGYPSIVYAADHNCKVINLSWGGPGNYSQTAQNIINYAAINKDIVVIAAGGNTPSWPAHYPATYNHVLSVAAYDTMHHAGLDSIIERPANPIFTNNYYIDMGAMGRRVFSTTYGGYSGYQAGSSYAAPLVAGAAGLVRSKYPSLNALQVAELLRVTTDPLIDTVVENLYFKQERAGKGRLNMYRALTDNISPAIRMVENKITDDFGNFAFSGDTLQVRCNFRNYLQPTNNATVTISSPNPNIEIIQGTFLLGSLPTLEDRNNNNAPFRIYVKPTAGINEQVFLRLGYSDPATNYTDYQYFEFRVNPDYVDIDTNEISVTVTSNGRFGFIDALASIGNGFEYKGQSIMYEGGLMISTGKTKVSDCVRGADMGNTDNEFNFISPVKYVKSLEGDLESKTVLTDNLALNPIGITIEQRTYASEITPDDKHVVIEYHITNNNSTAIDSLMVGLFVDWDIQNYNQNKSNWSSKDSIGYSYYTGTNGIYAGISILTPNPPICFSMENASTGGNNINPNDGFTTIEKHKTLSQGIGRTAAGGGGAGFDVSQVVGGLLLNVLPNEKRTIAFAFVAGDNFSDLQNNAHRARDKFKLNNTSPTPIINNFHYCLGNTESPVITPENGVKFNFYKAPDFTNPLHVGSSFTYNTITNTDTIYVSSIDSIFESHTEMSTINFHSEVKAKIGLAPDTLDLSQASYIYFVDKSDYASTISWDLGDGTIINNQSEFLHEYSTTGTYKVILKAVDSYGCEDTISRKVVIKGRVDNKFPYVQDGVSVYPIPANETLNIQFYLDQPEHVTINLYNELGKELFSTSINDIMLQTYPIPLETYKKGIYFARIKIGEKTITRTFIVQ
jgi:PKD repeat protein